MPADACQDDTKVGVAAGNSGAAFIFGGNSTLFIDNQSTLEMFSRTWGAYRVSLVAVPAGTPGWTQSSPSSEYVLNESTGNASFTTHGMIYAPDTNVSLFASNNTVATSYGGVYVNSIMLQASTSGTGLALEAPASAPGNAYRTVVLTATAKRENAAPQVNGQQRAEAVVQIVNDTNLTGLTAIVKSWRTVGVS